MIRTGDVFPEAKGIHFSKFSDVFLPLKRQPTNECAVLANVFYVASLQAEKF